MSLSDQSNSDRTTERELEKWRREWEANGEPEHSCLVEGVMMGGAQIRVACGVCGYVIEREV